MRTWQSSLATRFGCLVLLFGVPFSGCGNQAFVSTMRCEDLYRLRPGMSPPEVENILGPAVRRLRQPPEAFPRIGLRLEPVDEMLAWDTDPWIVRASGDRLQAYFLRKKLVVVRAYRIFQWETKTSRDLFDLHRSRERDAFIVEIQPLFVESYCHGVTPTPPASPQ